MRVFLTALLLAAASASQALGCTCAPPPNTPAAMAERIADPDFILFDARVLEVDYERSDGARAGAGVTTFELAYDWLGRMDGQRELMIKHRLASPSCGMVFTPSPALILVIAWRGAQDQLTLNLCSMPRPETWWRWREAAFVHTRQRPGDTDHP